jgi:Fe-S-cluster containining protein
MPSPSPCHDCQAPCCTHVDVALSSYDLHRLVRTLGVPWQLVAEARVEEAGAIPLGGAARMTLRLRRRSDESCTFLVRLATGHGRCGVYDARPSRCRVYPHHVELYRLSPEYDVALGRGALCPPAAAGRFSSAAMSTDTITALDDEIAERALELRLLRRWEAALAAARRQVQPGEFVAWSALLHEVLESVRGGVGEPRARWQLDAYRVIDGFPIALGGAAVSVVP